MKRHIRTLAACSAVLGVVVLGVVPSAQASFFIAPQDGTCKGLDQDLHGIGASGLKGALLDWGITSLIPSAGTARTDQGFGVDVGADYPACQAFIQDGAAGRKIADYHPTGSGSCRTILGVNQTGPRKFTDTATTNNVGTITDVAYCAAEQAPTEAQITEAERGPTATAGDIDHPSEAQILTLPVAQVADAIDVRLPDGCQVANSGDRQISRDDVEAAFAGTITTWGDIFGTKMTATSASPTSAECQAKQFSRVVRFDSSGTTFLVKRYLAGAAGVTGSGITWSEPTLGNTSWPHPEVTNLIKPTADGGGPLLDLLSAQGANGGIGYADVATSRSKDYGWTGSGSPIVYDPADTKIWLRVQRIANDSYNGPAVANAEGATGGNKGSACLNVVYSNLPATANLSASWADVTAVPTPTDYSICGLDYIMTSLWGNDSGTGHTNKPVFSGSTKPGEWRAVREFLRYITGIVRPGVGPSRLAPAGYAKVPDVVAGFAKCESSLVGWNRSSTDVSPSTQVTRVPIAPDAKGHTPCPA